MGGAGARCIARTRHSQQGCGCMQALAELYQLDDHRFMDHSHLAASNADVAAGQSIQPHSSASGRANNANASGHASVRCILSAGQQADAPQPASDVPQAMDVDEVQLGAHAVQEQAQAAQGGSGMLATGAAADSTRADTHGLRPGSPHLQRLIEHVRPCPDLTTAWITLSDATALCLHQHVSIF